MNGDAIALATLCAAGFTGLGSFVTFGIMRLASDGRCAGCSHPVGCGDCFGTCTRRIRVRNYVSGTRRGWKYEPCKCRLHIETRPAVTA